MSCKVETKHGNTLYAKNPSYLPLKEDFVIEGSFQVIG